ncbi:hypothetical protein CLV65_1634 [Pseudoscardovia suis]|uniref:Uncharacterized protein n=1 Tax=Pseudoscardovia suis TaxID=987063 RepID=A0A261EV42_9BIFI|nr:hypothetical protein PSSU_1170 [Pseudoscardovia suis]PJJ62721.1 hypothetical protein CLV65_1634 [Pseudoscardovia suis]
MGMDSGAPEKNQGRIRANPDGSDACYAVEWYQLTTQQKDEQ